MSIKLIAFDFSGVLLLPDSTRRFSEEVSSKLNLPQNKVYDLFSWETLLAYNNTDITIDEYISIISKKNRFKCPNRI